MACNASHFNVRTRGFNFTIICDSYCESMRIDRMPAYKFKDSYGRGDHRKGADCLGVLVALKRESNINISIQILGRSTYPHR